MIEHVRAWAGGARLRAPAGRGSQPRRSPCPATPGRESAPTVVLQGHLDMVCERDPASPNDPAEGRIALVRDGEWLKADGTTLGADDGVAIAAMMALVEDESLPHGPLELLMTVAEEVGLEGANALDGSLAHRLDPDQPRQRGGRDADRRLRGQHRHLDPGRGAARAAAADAATLSVVPSSGGLGGHSGSSIALGRVERDQGARPGAARGATRRCRSGSSRSTAARAATRSRATRRRSARSRARPGELPSARRSSTANGDDPRRVREDRRRRLGRAVERADAAADAVDGRRRPRGCSTSSRSCRPGPLAMSPDFDDLVETSTSLGEAITEGDQPDAAQPLALVERLGDARGDRGARRGRAARGRRARGEAQLRRLAPGPGLAVARGRAAVYERLFGEPPIVTAVHAGLETAVIGGKVAAALDMLSLGPQIEVAALAGRACQHPDRRAVLAAAGRRPRRALDARRGRGRHARTSGSGSSRSSPASSLVLVVTAMIGTRDNERRDRPGRRVGAERLRRGRRLARRDGGDRRGRSARPTRVAPRDRGAAVGDAAGANRLRPRRARARHPRDRHAGRGRSTTRASPTRRRASEAAKLVSELGGLRHGRPRGRAGLARRGGRLARGRRSTQLDRRRRRDRRRAHAAA